VQAAIRGPGLNPVSVYIGVASYDCPGHSSGSYWGRVTTSDYSKELGGVDACKGVYTDAIGTANLQLVGISPVPASGFDIWDVSASEHYWGWPSWNTGSKSMTIIVVSPTPTPTPTPANWIQAVGGDVYQKSVSQEVPIGQKFVVDIYITTTPVPQSAGVIWYGQGTPDFGLGQSSNTGWQTPNIFSNPYDFIYYDSTLRDQKVDIDPAVTVIGKDTDLQANQYVYRYSGVNDYTFVSATGTFTPLTDETIFLINGNLTISENFAIASNQAVVFLVNGNITIGDNVTRIPGLYIASGTFETATSVGVNRLIIDGMVYARRITLDRNYHSEPIPAHQFIYQPKYIIVLLKYLGRANINWQEMNP